MAKVASIGECMVELSPRPGGLFGLGFGGDTLNTAVYLARLGVAVDYLTALGDDRYSERMLAAWRAEGIGTGLVPRLPGRLPGLYIIEVGEGGERRFAYWRDRAPARELFTLPQAHDILSALEGYDIVYLSGISLSLYDTEGRRALLAGLDRAREVGARVAFDCNYRARQWANARAARAAVDAMLERVDIALTSFDDERAIYGDPDAAAAAGRLRRAGVGEVVVKQGEAGCLVLAAAGAEPQAVPATPTGPVVDTTAAGDSFNAAYLAARLAGRPPAEAAQAGHRLAAEVVRHPGAIIPREAMPPELPAPAEQRP
ncbi:MAG: sugar kinase [Rhodospirillaceae bacterium]|nr:sugar kinase [Rhodospirillaceae bacterium]